MSKGYLRPDYADPGAALAYFTQSKRSGFLAGVGPVFWVVLCGAMLIGAIILGTGFVITNFRDRALTGTERQLENSVRLLARHFDRQLEDFESVHKSVAAEIQRQILSPEQFKRLLSGEQFHAYLKSKVSEASDFAGVNIFDADGAFINSSERWPVPAINLSNRHYFRSLRADRRTVGFWWN